MNWSVERKIVFRAGIVFLVLAVNAVISYQAARTFIKNEFWVSHTHEVLAELEATFSTLKDAESGQRGYLLTGIEAYLEPFNDAVTEIQGHTRRLRDLTADNSQQQARLAPLEDAIAARISKLDEGIALRKSQGLEAAQQVILTDRGRQLMSDIRSIVTEMTDRERDLLNARAAQSHTSARNSTLTFAVASLLAIALLVVVTVDTVRDVRARRRIETAMRASEERFSKAFAASPLAMSISRFADRRFIEVNDSFERVTGYRREEVLGRHGLEIGLWPTVEERDQVPRIADGQGTLRNVECRLRLQSGAIHTFSLSAETIEIGGEQCVLSVIDDITERKQREEALREAMATSERNRAQFEAVFQTVADGIVVSDMRGNLVLVNEAEARINGYRSAAEMQQNLAYFADVYEFNTPDGKPLPLDEWPLSKALRGESFTEWELRGRRKDTGQNWFFSFSGEPVRNEREELVMVIIVTRDITERKQAEAEIHLLNEGLEQRVTERTAQLEAVNKELESFSYSVSHDLRAPLRAIDGFSRILLEDYADKLDGEGNRVLNVVRSNTAKMSQLIDDLLEFSRLGRRAMEEASVALGELAQAVFDELCLANPQRSLSLQIGQLPPARGDRAMLRQVMINLLSNAVKFTRTRAVGEIEIGSQIENGQTVYYVRDNGAGFDMQYADKLFGVFQRLHSDKEYEGTGVGLSLVQRIVDRHGGRVWAAGEIGKGATFFFTLSHPD